MTYLLDTHSAGSDALHILSLIRSATKLLSYSATFFVNSVFVEYGFTSSLLVLGACQATCWLVSVPMYMYGKRVRSFVSTRCISARFLWVSAGP